MSQFDHEDETHSPALNALIREMAEEKEAYKRMKPPRVIENLLSHLKNDPLGAEHNPACTEEIVKILEWVLGQCR